MEALFELDMSVALDNMIARGMAESTRLKRSRRSSTSDRVSVVTDTRSSGSSMGTSGTGEITMRKT